jgi:hypothetical protein
MVIRSKRANEKIVEKEIEQKQDDDQSDWIDQFYGVDGTIVDHQYDDEYDLYIGGFRILDDGSDFW